MRVSELSTGEPAPQKSGRWSELKINQWYASQPYLIGANYIPATAINQLEMWQAETFDPERIDLELGWARDMGMNTMRVFLHDLLWEQDSAGFLSRIDQFLSLCEKHQIKPMLVFFDSCWDPDPAPGPQRAPREGLHNSGWLQSPGAKALQDLSQHQRLENYVRGVISHFAKDDRILIWDLWNEPNNLNDIWGESWRQYHCDLPDKHFRVLDLLPKVFEWARSADPAQPLTSPVWRGEWGSHITDCPIEQIQIQMSDIISFHNYDPGPEFRRRIETLSEYKRPILCTEYMARAVNSTFDEILPLAHQFGVAAYNWGFVRGKTQTHYHTNSWQNPAKLDDTWFHDILDYDGTPHQPKDLDIIRHVRGKPRFPSLEAA